MVAATLASGELVPILMQFGSQANEVLTYFLNYRHYAALPPKRIFCLGPTD
jgi:hypothetical protein